MSELNTQIALVTETWLMSTPRLEQVTEALMEWRGLGVQDGGY